MKKLFLLPSTLFTLITFMTKAQTVTDKDGNVYNTVTIGTQVWMKENLKTTKYSNGDVIPNINPAGKWFSLTVPAWCYYDSNNIYNKTYGKLYNGYAAFDSRNLCPIGFHVPTYSDWDKIYKYLGGKALAGGAMKDTGTINWFTPNLKASNSSNFTGLPGGYREAVGGFFDQRYSGNWWSSTSGWYGGLYYGGEDALLFSYDLKFGLSIRCLKDASSGKIDSYNIQHISIYPNPVREKILLDNLKEENISVRILNLLGETIIQKELEGERNEIEIMSIPEGFYFIQINGGNWTERYKIFKR